MPAADQTILRLSKAKSRLLPFAVSFGIIWGASGLASSAAFGETLSMATATLTQSEATEAMSHGGNVQSAVPVPMASAAPATAAPVSLSSPNVAAVKPAAPIVVASADDDDDDDDSAAMESSDRAADVPKSTSNASDSDMDNGTATSMADDAAAAEPAASSASSGSWFSGWFSWGSKSDDTKDDDDDMADDDMPAAATANAVAHAQGEAAEAPAAAAAAAAAIPGEDKNAQAAASGGLVDVKAQAGTASTPPHADVFAQPTPPSAAQTSPVLPLSPADAGPIRPEQARAWAEDLQLLERENQALREKLHVGEADPLADIKVDAVSQIREDVLRARVVELEKELDKLHMKRDPGDLPQKTTPSRPSASLSNDNGTATDTAPAPSAGP